MCKLRSYRHSCGHSTTQHLSTCRGTFASPTTDAALCHASPSLTVAFPGPCRSCEYTSFCNEWEDRIADAEARHNAARQLISEIEEDYSIDDYWGSGGSSYSGGGSHSGGGFSFDSGDDAYGFGDADLAERERTRAEAEIERLRTQFYKEQWGGWRAMVTGPSDESIARRRNRYRRRGAPRTCGDSPLKTMAIAADEDYEEDRDENQRHHRADSDTPSDESRSTNSDDVDEREQSPHVAPFSWDPVPLRRQPSSGLESGPSYRPSLASYTPGWSGEDDELNMLGAKPSWVSSWSSSSSSSSRARKPIGSILNQIEEDDLLPDYGMA